MDSDQGKLFIGGISWETTEEKLKEYFENYGEVVQTVVMREKFTGRPRGFGFVVFSDPSVLDRVLQDTHTIDGRTVEAKRALSREEQQTTGRTGNPNSGRNSGGSLRTKKIFVGGLPATLSEEGFRDYFETYGQVTDVVVMYDQNTGRPRGFGFISFESEESVDRVLQKTFHDLNGKQVEVKRALPKDANPGGGGGGGSRSAANSGGSQNAYDSRLDNPNRYMQPQSTGGGFPPYGGPGYGYGPSSNGMGYAGYSNYNNPAGAVYGNPNAPSRSSWNPQAPAGYGAMGYGNTAPAAPWGVTGGGAAPGSAPAGQSPVAQGYGYGGYGGADGGYGTHMSGYGGRPGVAPNSDMQGGGGGYMAGGGYTDANGNSWRSDQSLGSGNYGSAQTNSAPVGYGGGVPYGSGAPARQAQQQ